ncbi:nuclear transport factor 2 family protein [Xanthocytophaga agilis]|uniref:Nuclear transport factor 2 family protein n=1 Tax=Xanthocytophaga agilis TaxID=3048010 RepID=A0AAE3R0M9_9BACT|nr:nuclear transport factor 2 family protein [Xanthocytophaga agilis]MDJ1501551.1 nuclear transport factor 2 family protein [Xanthocytophaga agilis]
MTTAKIERLVERHLELWNQKDQTSRNVLMQEVYATDIEMVDRHFIAVGHAHINEFIQNLQQKNPNFRFSHRYPIDTHHNIARLYWQFGSKEKPDVVTGMDLFVIEKDKVQKLYVFVDEPNK